MQTIGERLEEARKRKGVSIREAAEATKIRGDYLQKFESNQFDLGLAELYVRGFLRSYANFLKLPAEKIVTDFNGLTAGSSSARRTPSREVYGRMDLSVASADSPDAGAPAAGNAGSGEAESTAARRSPSSFTRGGGTIQQGPTISPDLVVKIVIGVVGLVVLLLVVWGIKSIAGGKSTATTPPAAAAPAAQHVIKLVALAPIHVEVALPKADDPAAPGTIIYSGDLATGQIRPVERNGDLFITASASEQLNLEFPDGSVTSLRAQGYIGYKTLRLPGP